MPRCFLWLVTAVTAVTASKGESGHLEDGNALVRRHELEASQSLSQQSLYQAAVDFAGEVHTFKSRHQDRGFGSLESGAAAAAASRARAAASPAIASSNDPRDADDVARPPSPSRLVSANTMTSPPAADISAFPQTGNGGKLVPAPPQSDQSGVPTNAPKHKVHKHAVQHRLTMTTLALCMLSSGILGLLVVWRQGKVLLNKPRRGEDEPDFQEQVARVLQKRSSQASVRSKDSGARDARDARDARERTSQASSSSAQVVQQVQVERHLEAPATLAAPEAPEAPAATTAPASSAAVAASAMAAPAPERFDERDAEADAAGGGMRKSQPKN